MVLDNNNNNNNTNNVVKRAAVLIVLFEKEGGVVHASDEKKPQHELARGTNRFAGGKLDALLDSGGRLVSAHSEKRTRKLAWKESTWKC